MLGQKDDMSPYIYIQKDPFKAEAIRITFDNDTEFNKWLDVVQVSRKSEQEMEQFLKKQEEGNQVIEPKADGVKPQATVVERRAHSMNEEGSTVQRSKTSASGRGAASKSFSKGALQLATKISSEDEISKIISQSYTKVYETVDWFLRESTDGINVLTDNATVEFSTAANYVNPKQLITLLS